MPLKIDMDFTKEKKKVKDFRKKIDRKISEIKYPESEKVKLAKNISDNSTKTVQLLLKIDQELLSMNFRLEAIESQLRKNNLDFMKLVNGDKNAV